MRLQLTSIFALALLACGPRTVLAEEDPIGDALDGISGEAMLEVVKELSSDKMLGRKTGWKGGPLVEEWIAVQFANFGLHPADQAGAYLEPYRFASTNIKAPIDCTVAGNKLAYGKDFSHLSYSGSGKVEAPVVFCGYGVHRPDMKWDDYAGVDVKGKIVIAIRGLPDNADSGLGVERFIGYKSSAAADKGAVGFMLVESEKPLTGTIQAQYYRKDLPSLWLSQAAVDKLLASTGKKIADLKQAYDEGKGGKAFDTGSKASMEVNSEFKKSALGHNVLARIDGRDPDLKREIVLVSAHCDHLGVGPDGAVFNGADDNASGTAVLVHLADILSLNKFRPKRTIVFCAFSGEEQGLHGSMELVRRQPFQGNIVAVLNMDMVGQGEPVVSCAGVGSYPLIGKRLQDAIPEAMKASVHFSPRAGGGSDHWPFYERGIPAFAISTRGKHPNYHTPLDDVGNIKAANLEITAKVVGRWVATLAAEEKPLYDDKALARFLVDDTARVSLGGPTARKTHDGMFVGSLSTGDFEKDLENFKKVAAKHETVFVRTPADLRRARAERKHASLLVAQCGSALQQDPTKAAWLADLGYRVLQVGGSGGELAVPTDAVLEAVRKQDVVIDLTCVPVKALPDVARKLAGRPAFVFIDRTQALPSPIPGILFCQHLNEPADLSAAQLGRSDVAAFTLGDASYGAHIADALGKMRLDLSPGSKDRKRVRDWLGEAFVRLLGK